MKCIIFTIVFFILVKIYTVTVFAASISSSSQQTEISHDQEFAVQASLSIQSGDGTNYYLRGVFYKEGTSNYCGITWNGSEWFSGPYSTNEGWKKFLKITVTSNVWQGELKVKIDREDSGCKDSGSYKFKIQRFNEGSGSSTFDDQSELSLNISIPTSTPTPTSTPKPTPTTKPSFTTKPTSTPKPSLASKNANPTTQVVTLSPTDTLRSFDINEDKEVEGVLGVQDIEGEESDPNIMLHIATRSGVVDASSDGLETNVSSGSGSLSKSKNPFVALGGAVSLLASCGILVMRKFRGA